MAACVPSSVRGCEVLLLLSPLRESGGLVGWLASLGRGAVVVALWAAAGLWL